MLLSRNFGAPALFHHELFLQMGGFQVMVFDQPKSDIEVGEKTADGS